MGGIISNRFPLGKIAHFDDVKIIRRVRMSYAYINNNHYETLLRSDHCNSGLAFSCCCSRMVRCEFDFVWGQLLFFSIPAVSWLMTCSYLVWSNQYHRPIALSPIQLANVEVKLYQRLRRHVCSRTVQCMISLVSTRISFMCSLLNV